MPFIPTPLTMHASMGFILRTKLVRLGFYFRYTGTFNDNTEAVQDTISAWWNTALRNHVSTNLVWEELELRDTSVADGRVIIDSSMSSGGAVSSDVEINQAAMTITWQTGLAGRSYRGRSFIPGIASAAGQGINWSTAIVANIAPAQFAAPRVAAHSHAEAR